jgi:hypothetical protein
VQVNLDIDEVMSSDRIFSEDLLELGEQTCDRIQEVSAPTFFAQISRTPVAPHN